jgi:N-6 DNA Methylase
MSRSPHAFALAADAISVEGALIPPAMLARVAKQEADGQSDADYKIPKGLTLRDEIARYFRIGQALFAELNASPTPSTAKTIAFVEALFRDVFGFADMVRVGTRSVNERLFAVTLEGVSGRVPVVVVPPSDLLDRASDHLPTDGRRRSAAIAVQDWLNAQEGVLWGFCCNGERLRLLRDNASLTRPAYIEADLRQIFEAESFADFTVLWLLIHASRFGLPGGPATDCALERWRESGGREGAVARDRLRDGVEAALKVLGTGFLAGNSDLRQRVQKGELALADFFGQLLRLVYRLVFLLAAEDRGLLHAPDAPPAARLLYAQGYSLSTLRDRAVRRAAWDAHHDKWEGLAVVFAALARGEKLLGLPPLGGLFAPDMMADIESAYISNRALMEAIFRLAWLRENVGLVPVNWRDMETEELGSVYESLLELTPRLIEEGRGLAFAKGGEEKGHARKTTSSYYTPDALVQVLLDSALEPVLERVEAEADNTVEALLGVTVIDPACGSGHFLLAAGRRIATRLARVRAGGVASAQDFRRALRDVARACLHGVDRNPMAVELTKVALWIETVDPGKPLGFLDVNIRCGDALFGVFDIAMLGEGIPDEAYKPLAGDDKPTARYYAARNRDERRGQGSLDFARGGGKLPAAAPLAQVRAALRALPEDSAEQVAERRRRFEAVQADRLTYSWGEAANLFIAAFLLPKTGGPLTLGQGPMVPTTGDVWRAMAGEQGPPALVARATEVSRNAHAFHWSLEFPDVMARGGFDVVLGNPPWDTMSPDAKEFFSPYDGQVRFMSPDDQKARIAELLTLPGLAEAWNAYCHRLYALANFFKESGRYTLFAEGNLGKGDFNVYRMFTELALRLARPQGRAAQFVPENLYNGANAAAIRRFLFDECQLDRVIAFENTRRVWFDIHTAAKFCLYVASPGARTISFGAAFGVNSREKLAALSAGLPIEMPISLIEEFSPDAFAIAEVAHPSDISISRKLYGRLPKFGADVHGAPAREYMREIDMGNDREDFDDDPNGVPLYEGRMVEAFDHRAKGYVSGRGRSAVWRELGFGSPTKAVAPQWHLSPDLIPTKAASRWQEYRLAFCDVGGVTNARFLMAALVPPKVICGHSVPTILFHPQDDRLSMLWLGIANSFCVDFLARKKAALHMTYTVLDSLPLPRCYSATPLETAIARRALMLSATGAEMAEFRNRTAPPIGLTPDDGRPCEDPVQRRTLRAELDVLVARDFFGLTRDEMRYLLDPADILGPDCGFETFGALKRAEARAFGGAFMSRDLILETWDRLPAPIDEGATACASATDNRGYRENRGSVSGSAPVARTQQ